jgi:glycosyltransferase involved in cell wall biosynthesis
MLNDPISQVSPKVLMIGFVWPETNASAAGLRDWAILETFRSAGWSVHYASPAKPGPFSEKLERMGVPTFSCEANDPRFDTFVSELKPDVVFLDRFVIEEQFGWRIEEACPNAIRVLDTQDLHFLRRARAAAIEEGWSLEQIQGTDPRTCASMIEKFSSEDLFRELSAIYRSDLTLMISSFEIELLRKAYGIPDSLLQLLRFSYEAPDLSALPGFSERRHFVSIGNFRHPPNADAVKWLKLEIWPEIRSRIPTAEIHLYGAYPSREMMDLSNPRTGFIVRGPADDQYKTLRDYRVLLAPLRFGAGIKGKISDSWSVGTAVVTTPVGAEGMSESHGTSEAPFEIARDVGSFVEMACALYEDEHHWERTRRAGADTLSRLYDTASNSKTLLESLAGLRRDLAERRRANLVGAMLRQNLHRSTKYFSKWIELKQSLARSPAGTPVA